MEAQACAIHLIEARNDYAKGRSMDTRFAISPDSTLIAFDVSGAGTPILLLHGGGGSRRDWHETGYVARLQDEFTVIPVDLRGHGESDKPTDPACYTTEKLGQDILAVADACELDHFVLLGYSFGGRIGSHLASCSNRVGRLVMLGNRLGTGVSPTHRQFVFDLRARWMPIVETAGNAFDPTSLSEQDQQDLGKLVSPGELLPSLLAWSTAMLTWGTVRPSDLLCPTLWLMGSENDKALDTLREYEHEIPDSNIQVRILEMLNHGEEFESIDQVLPIILSFIQQEK
jgi:pimeloyl-ACP methyl ester carboxylesterase